MWPSVAAVVLPRRPLRSERDSHRSARNGKPPSVAGGGFLVSGTPLAAYRNRWCNAAMQGIVVPTLFPTTMTGLLRTLLASRAAIVGATLLLTLAPTGLLGQPTR